MFPWEQSGSWPFTSLEEMRQSYFWSSTCSFPVARTVLSHLIADEYIHCCHPSHHFKTGQAVGVWWINHELSAIGSLRHWNLLNWVVGRTANIKGSVTCGLTSSHFWGLFFLICKPKVCMFTLNSWTFSLFFSLPTHMDRDARKRGKIHHDLKDILKVLCLQKNCMKPFQTQ